MNEDIIQRYQEVLGLLRARMEGNPTLMGNFGEHDGKVCFELTYFTFGGKAKKKVFSPGNGAEDALEKFIAVAQNLYLN